MCGISVVLSFERGFCCRLIYVGKLSFIGNVRVYRRLLENVKLPGYFSDGNAMVLCSSCCLEILSKIRSSNTQLPCYFQRECKEVCALVSLSVYLK